MQLVFGALALEGDPNPSFAHVHSATLTSWPAAAISAASGPFVAIGAVSRSFASWQDPGARLSVYLDGEILMIDGQATRERGSGSADLASVGELFSKLGHEAWSRLDGSFLLVVRVDTTVHVGVDVGGTRGVYWWEHGGALVFHSHLLDLAAAYPGALDEDWGAIATYLSSGLYPPGSTALRGIHHLGAGQRLSLTRSGATAASHFRLEFAPASGRSTDRLVDELVDLVTAATEARWQRAQHPVVPLSGGVDSRYLAAEIARVADPATVRTITWGEDPGREDGDAVVAAQVAARLGVANEWRAKGQRHTPETFATAIHLSSGECDAAIHFPDDHVLHGRLAEVEGFGSLFRGDQCLDSEACLTERAVRAAPGVTRLSPIGTYARLLGPSILAGMVRQQESVIASTLADLRSRTSTGRGDELWYEFGVRRLLAPYNALKRWDLEVYTPFLDRRILEWTRTVPDGLRIGKKILKAALRRRHPEVAGIPYARRTNLPAWTARSVGDPGWARFFLDWCNAPGWLDEIGEKGYVIAALEGMLPPAGRSARGHSGRRQALRRLAVDMLPAGLVAELAASRRSRPDATPMYLGLARLAVLHGLLGSIRERHGRRPPKHRMIAPVDRPG